jgi:hypothetical protein
LLEEDWGEMKLTRTVAGLALWVMSAPAEAATIERIFDVEASNFIFVVGPGTDIPVDPVDLNFTLIFDPSTTILPTSNGLTVNSFNLPDSSAYSLSPIDLVVASDPTNTGCVLTASTYCFFIVDPGGADPRAFDFGETTADTTDWEARTVTTSASAVVVVAETPTFALMVAGFAGLGLLRRQWIRLAGRSPTFVRLRRAALASIR